MKLLIHGSMQFTSMGMISKFSGIKIYMFNADHIPAHIHVYYGELEVRIDILTGQYLKATTPAQQKDIENFPSNILKDINLWRLIYLKDLKADWDLCMDGKTPNKISPLPIPKKKREQLLKELGL
jgi:hypothetical protein